MEQQTFKTHRRFVPMYHYVSSLLTAAVVIGSLVNLFKCIGSGEGVYSASLIAVLAINVGIIFYYMRAFPLVAQDRVIRAEENFRHYRLDGKPLDPKLTMRQIIGLRFASDEEFLGLEKRAVAENLSENDIKKAIKNWRPDTYRV